MKTIAMAQGQDALVDDADYIHIMEWGLRWRMSDKGYAEASFDKALTVAMHHLIIGKKLGYVTDHKNGNRLDNRRCNLRHATHEQNAQNRRSLTGKSKYIEVYWNKPSKKWMAYISRDGKKYNLGIYLKEKDAAKARDVAARDHQGSFARCNFPMVGDSNYERSPLEVKDKQV